jgi:hypothetical protein
MLPAFSIPGSATFALADNTTGDGNTAVGADALTRNTTGDDNTATGVSNTATVGVSERP